MDNHVPQICDSKHVDCVERCHPGQAHTGGLRDVDTIGDRSKQTCRNRHLFGERGWLPRRLRRQSPCYVHADVDVVHVIADGGNPAHEVATQQYGISLICQTDVAPADCGAVEVVHRCGHHVDDDAAVCGDWFADVEQ